MSEELGSASNPAHVRIDPEIEDQALKYIILASKIVSALYTAAMGWEMLKMLFPHLKFKQDMAVAYLREKMKEFHGEKEIYVPKEWVRSVYDDLRGDGDGG